MKPYTYAFLAAAAACGLASAAETAYTTPVGYVTQTLSPNQFNLIGVTVHNPTAAAGVIDAESSTSITDTQVNFTTSLEAGATYVLELPNGVIQEITAWSGSVLTTPQDITASVTPGATTYKIRKADTVSSLFGASNSAGLTSSPDGDVSLCDTIQLFNGSGFDVVYYYNDGSTTGWFDEGGNPAADKPVIYADGVYVKRVGGSPISFVTDGEIKTTPTSGVLAPGFNYLCSVAPAGLNLGNSGLQNFISQSPDGDTSTVDTVQVQVAGGAYLVCYYYNDGSTTGWFDEGGNPAESVSLDSGLLILNRGASKPFTLSVPTSYSSL